MKSYMKHVLLVVIALFILLPSSAFAGLTESDVPPWDHLIDKDPTYTGPWLIVYYEEYNVYRFWQTTSNRVFAWNYAFYTLDTAVNDKTFQIIEYEWDGLATTDWTYVKTIDCATCSRSAPWADNATAKYISKNDIWNLDQSVLMFESNYTEEPAEVIYSSNFDQILADESVWMQTKGYNTVYVMINGNYIKTIYPPLPSILTDFEALKPFEWSEYIKTEGRHEIVFRGFNEVDGYVSPGVDYTFLMDFYPTTYTDTTTPLPEPDTTDVPAPTAPNSSWDVIGWLKYLIEWVKYAFQVVTVFLQSLTSEISLLMGEVVVFQNLLSSFFNFMPPAILSMLIAGVAVAVILKIFGR